MLSVQRKAAPCYKHCDQTVTVYHQEGDSYRQMVIKGVYLDYRKNSNIDKIGSREVNSFLLILPQGAGGMHYLSPSEYLGETNTYTIAANDKVLLGEGQEIVTAEQWRALIPSKVDGMVVVQQVDPKYYMGSICHLEVGG